MILISNGNSFSGEGKTPAADLKANNDNSMHLMDLYFTSFCPDYSNLEGNKRIINIKTKEGGSPPLEWVIMH